MHLRRVDKMVKVESFSLDHTKVKAPFVRKCGTQKVKWVIQLRNLI